jgi:hypothetical protein
MSRERKFVRCDDDDYITHSRLSMLDDVMVPDDITDRDEVIFMQR